LTGLPSPSVAAPLIGDAAPPLDLPSLDPNRANATLGPRQSIVPRPGHIWVVDFFATWCGPCLKATVALDEVLRPLGDRVTLIVVDVNQPAAMVQAHFQKQALPKSALLVLDSDGQAAKRWGQDRFPTTFLIDERGVIAHINRGYGPGYQARMERWLRAMLSPPSSPSPSRPPTE
jgi:thiol-disulfide isomerase/thioredoxin